MGISLLPLTAGDMTKPARQARSTTCYNVETLSRNKHCC